MKRSDSPKPRRVRVAEGIYKQGDSYIAGFRDPESGRWTMPTLHGASTLTEARRVRRALISDLEAKRIASRTSLTLSTLAEEWFATRGAHVKPRTLQKDAASVVLIKRFFGTARVQDIDGRRIEAFLVALRAGRVGKSKKPLAEWTIVGVVKTLRQILDRAVIGGVITINPLTRVQRHTLPKQKNRTQPRVLTAEEIDKLVAAAVRRTPCYAPIIATAAYTGARIREVLGLRWSDIDPSAQLIRFSKQIDVEGTSLVPLKTEAAERTNAIVPRLEPFLGRAARMQARWSADDDFVFSATRGKPREYRNVRRAIAVAAAEAGLGHVRCHDLRHSATSVLLAHADLVTVSKYVGHQSPAVTMRVYAHALGDPEEQAGRIAAAAKAAGFGQ